MKAVDVHGFGGGFTLGTVRAGFDLVGKMSREVGFGVLNCLANRQLLGDNWDSIPCEPKDWPAMETNLVFGNPPCSGFSTLSPKHFRGNNSSINECMWELVRYAGRVSPEIVIFESVQQAFRQGVELMRQLHAELESMTGHKYHLYHVLHNNASVGGVSNRRRYFWVASRIPFGVDHYPLQYVPTLGSALRDLMPMGLTMRLQPYRGISCSCGSRDRTDEAGIEGPEDCTCESVGVLDASRWVKDWIHDGTGFVDGHEIVRSPLWYRVEEILRLEEWEQGEAISDVLRKHYARTSEVPKLWHYPTKGEWGIMNKADRLIQTDFAMGHNQTVRWKWDELARVVTGGGCHLVLHPKLPRLLTHREVARIQGFPDAWRIWPVRNAADLGPAWGKGVPVQAGQWIAGWARKALEGQPGAITGDPITVTHRRVAEKYGTHDRETVIDLTYDWRDRPLAESRELLLL